MLTNSAQHNFGIKRLVWAETKTDLIAGYESARSLTVVERELLPDLIVARLCNSLLMSAQARAMDPNDEYLRISERPVAELLMRLSR